MAAARKVKSTSGVSPPRKVRPVAASSSASGKTRTRKPKADDLSNKLVAIVEAQRQLGGNSYPISLKRLAELAGATDSDALKACLKPQTKKVLALSLAATAKTKADDIADAQVFLAPDADRIDFQRVLVALLHREPRAFTQKELVKGASKPLLDLFDAALHGFASSRSPPNGVGLVPGKAPEVLFFLLEHAVLANARAVVAPDLQRPDLSTEPTQISSNPPIQDFDRRFEAAFRRLDQEQGERNYVLLHGLRAALSDVPREQFDAHLMKLRRSRRFTLDPSDGRHDRLTAEQLEAGITEAGNRLVYVARRTDS